MIFKSIKLQNFRQYKNEIEFIFSLPSDNKKNMTLIIAGNRVGKTTLLQAFRYCFYGSTSNYLNLPKADELLNNTLVDKLKDLESANMYVEVTFVHEDVHYIARREQKFIKTKGLMKEIGKEEFKLSYLENHSEGYKVLTSEDSYDKIRSILPEGLSQVFMFDGERMETNISDRKFSSDLKESILGILDIKKYDKLIEVLGDTGKVSTVIGMLNTSKRTTSFKEKKVKDDYETLLSKKSCINEEIENINSDIEDLDNKIKINKEQQEKIVENNERKRQMEKLELENDYDKDRLKQIALDYIKISRRAIIYKLMLLNKRKYDVFINQGPDKEHFYSHLHVNTIEDILDKGKCVCGRPVKEHSAEYHHLNNLRNYSLPIESAQHLNIIDQKFKQTVEYNEVKLELDNLKNSMRIIKKEIRDRNEEISRLNRDIIKVENQYGIHNQENINELLERKGELLKKSGEKISELKMVEKAIRQLQNEIDKIDEKNEYNTRINSVIDVVKNIKERLLKIKNEKEEVARQVLSNKFNEVLSKVMQGSYKVTVNEKYKITIVDLTTNKDVTAVLSTGQNVVVSLSFITALINTAKELSSKINKSEKYGVIMDAALSNLDEIHIDRLCRYNLKNVDQLIFLSFKRQLRDEMYRGIKNNIGKSYILRQDSNGYVEKCDMPVEFIGEYIHKIEEE